MFKKILVILLILACLLQPAPAYAWRGRGGSALGIVAVSLAGASLLYSAGMFYRSTPAGYVVMPAPMGAVVPGLPPGYTVVYMNGVPYYYYGNTYYAAAPNGYVVTTPPAIATPMAVAPPQASVTAPMPQAATAAPAVNEPSDAVETYIPNGTGVLRS